MTRKELEKKVLEVVAAAMEENMEEATEEIKNASNETLMQYIQEAEEHEAFITEEREEKAMTTIKNLKTGEVITRDFTESQLAECKRDGFEIIRKAIATIETEIGTMTIYYNGTDAEITGETSDGETVENTEYTPNSLEDAIDVVGMWYSGGAAADWDLTWID